MKVTSLILLLSAYLATAAPIGEGGELVERTNERHRASTGQLANSGNVVWSSNNGGRAKNGDTRATSGRNGYAEAAPIAEAYGADTDVTSGSATNSASGSRRKNVGQVANSGNFVSSSNNGGKASNGDTTATSGKNGEAYAQPYAGATGGDTFVESGNASNNAKRSNGSNRGSTGQIANSGNLVKAHGNGGKASNGNTHASSGKYGYAEAAPIAEADGADTGVVSGDAKNEASGGRRKNVGQVANSGNVVGASGNGGKASNGDTTAHSGKYGESYASPQAVAGGGDTRVESGDASNHSS